MTAEEIQQNNELIALFMGLEKQEQQWRAPQPTTAYLVHDYWTPVAKMKYHSSWEWLMPVGKKIFDYLQEVARNRPRHTCSQGDLIEVDISCAIREYDREKAHQYIVDFIKWYNQQTQTS